MSGSVHDDLGGLLGDGLHGRPAAGADAHARAGAAGAGDGDDVDAGLAVLAMAAGACEMMDVARLQPGRMLAFATGLQRHIDRVRVLQARVLCEADRAKATTGTGSRDAADHVANATGSSKGDLRGQADLGRALEDHPELDDAVTQGRVSPAAAKAVTDSLNAAGSGADKRELMDRLEGAGPAQAKQRAEDWAREQRRRAGTAEDEEAGSRRRFAARGIWSTPEVDGLVTTTVVLPTLQSRQVLTALDHLVGQPGDADTRTQAQRRADALVELAHAYAAGSVSGGRERATILVSITEEAMAGLTDDPGWTSHGDRIPACEVRRLAEDAVIRRIVMAGSEVIDLGRRARLASGAQFEALCVRDGGCRDPFCTIPAAWCEVDHLREWTAEGGETDLDEMVLWCSFHHHLRHRPGVSVLGDAHDLRLQLPDGTIIACPPKGRTRPAAA